MLVKNELRKLQAFDSSYTQGKIHFVDDDGTQNYFVFKPIFRYFKRIGNADYILEWKSIGLSDEFIKFPVTTNNILNPSLDFVGDRIRGKFNGSCLKQNKITYAHKTIVYIYIVYEISKTFYINSYPTLENGFFWSS